MICSWCILIYLKGNLFDGSFNLPCLVTTSQDSFLYYLSVWKIFSKNSFFSISRGVPFDCGCKGRYFLQTDQTLLQLFYKKFLTIWLSRWFSNTAINKDFQRNEEIWKIHVAKHGFLVFLQQKRFCTMPLFRDTTRRYCIHIKITGA